VQVFLIDATKSPSRKTDAYVKSIIITHTIEELQDTSIIN